MPVNLATVVGTYYNYNYIYALNYVYAFESEVKDIFKGESSILAHYADTHTVLLRLTAGNRPAPDAKVTRHASPSARTVPMNPAVEAHYAGGKALEESDQLVEAIGSYDKAIALDPVFYPAYNKRGDLYGKEGRFDWALEDLSQAIALNPSYATAYTNRGRIYLKMDMRDEALADLNRAIELDQDTGNGEAFFFRGTIHLKGGDRARGLADLSEACKLGNKDGCDALQNVRSR